MNRYDSVMAALDEVRPPSAMRHRNSSPGVRPKSEFPRRSCDGHFAFLTAGSSNDRQQYFHPSVQYQTEYQALTGRQFRPRVNTLPDALSGVSSPECDKVRDRERARSHSYTPSPNVHNGSGRRRRRSQERILETDNWKNYRKPSADLRKFSISDDCDYFYNNHDRSGYRILVLGADRVGKSSLLRQLVCEEEIEKMPRKDRNVKMVLQIEDKDISITFDNQPFRDDLLNNGHHHEKVREVCSSRAFEHS